MKTFTVTFTNGDTCKVDSTDAKQAKVKAFILSGGKPIATVRRFTGKITGPPRSEW